MPVCVRKGCEASYVENDNNPTACQFHSKGPIFHEGLKGWGCCSKRVTSFDDFLKIPGCTWGKHTDLKSEDENPTPPLNIEKNTNTNSSIKPSSCDSSKKEGTVETFQAQGQSIFSNLSKPENPKKSSLESNKENEKPKPIEIEEDPLDAIISVGAKCKRGGCNYIFVSDEISRRGGKESICTFHPGSPVFHEGSKGWSCCSRKVLEFDEFLKIGGCKEGNHCFIGKSEPEVEKVVEFRHDWYQTQTEVIISVFAKSVDKDTLSITFEDQGMKVYGKLGGGGVLRWNLKFSQPISKEQCKYRVLSTKIEIRLCKGNGISWASLEKGGQVQGWTTFGITGGTGTVGAKEMQINNDSALLADMLNK